MIASWNYRLIGVLAISVAVLLQSCSTPSIALNPATIIKRDVFVCKGLSEDNRWVGVTDQFLPDKDSRVVVVAFLDKQDEERTIYFELTNPIDNVVASETLYHPKKNPIGIYFSIPRLMKLGGEGKWKALVFVDGEPIGEAIFYLGEKPASEEKEEGPRYFVVGAENPDEAIDSSAQDISEEDRFSSYIREATPELTIPLPTEPIPATETKSATP